MLEVAKMEENEDTHPEEYKEYKERMARIDDTPTHQFQEHEEVKYKEPNMMEFNLGDHEESRLIVVGDNWDPALKGASLCNDPF